MSEYVNKFKNTPYVGLLGKSQAHYALASPDWQRYRIAKQMLHGITNNSKAVNLLYRGGGKKLSRDELLPMLLPVRLRSSVSNCSFCLVKTSTSCIVKIIKISSVVNVTKKLGCGFLFAFYSNCGSINATVLLGAYDVSILTATVF